MSRTVHVLLGSSAVEGFVLGEVRTGEPGVFTTYDSLSCGPLGPIVNVRSWREQRSEYWRNIDIRDRDATDEPLFDDPAILATADGIVLWLGTGLDDQIALAWLPTFLRLLDIDPGRLGTIQIERNPRGLEITGLGILSSRDIAAHPPPVALKAEHLAELDLVWRALTSSEPAELVAYLQGSAERFPLLKRALRSLLSRYPDSLSGVNATEMRVLDRVKRLAPNTVRIIGQLLGDNVDALRAGTGGLDHFGDVWLYARMLRLAHPALRETALAMTGLAVPYRDTEVRLTPFGERILNGAANFVDTNGIDDWVAGVHLQSEVGMVWLNDEGQLKRR